MLYVALSRGSSTPVRQIMTTKRILLSIMIIVLVIVAAVAWMAWTQGNFGAAHLVGLGASVLLLALIWFWPGNWQPRQPPP
jgi:hypothetical protein